MVAHGDASMAIVFATDAATDPGVEIIGTFPDETHPKVLYTRSLFSRRAVTPMLFGFWPI
jgi:molybdate transport system substrate-binding protein